MIQSHKLIALGRKRCHWLLRPDFPAILACVATAILLASTAQGRPKQKESDSHFTYVGGTVDLQPGCWGDLQITDQALNFQCGNSPLTIPYTSIKTMQYRPDVPSEIRKMKLMWKVRPPGKHFKENRYFTVVFNDGAETQVLIMRVRPLPMRPYLAQIDLKSGRQIEVYGYEDYR